MGAALPYLFIGIILNATAQLLLKGGMNHIGHFAFKASNVVPIALKVAVNPFIIAGLSCYVLSVVAWLMVLSRVEVGIAYPMVSLGYIVTAIASSYLFHENLSISQIVGIGIIIFGVILISRPSF